MEDKKHIIAEVIFYSGVRKAIPTDGYRPDAIFNSSEPNTYWGIMFPEMRVTAFDTPTRMEMRFTFHNAHYDEVQIGQSFTIMEGATKVGEGKVIEIKWLATKRRIKLETTLKQGTCLVYEVDSNDPQYRTWIVLRDTERGYVEARLESFRMEDITNADDPIGNHSFSDLAYFETLESLNNYLSQFKITFEDFIESWNSEYPL